MGLVLCWRWICLIVCGRGDALQRPAMVELGIWLALKEKLNWREPDDRDNLLLEQSRIFVGKKIISS